MNYKTQLSFYCSANADKVQYVSALHESAELTSPESGDFSFESYGHGLPSDTATCRNYGMTRSYNISKLEWGT